MLTSVIPASRAYSFKEAIVSSMACFNTSGENDLALASGSCQDKHQFLRPRIEAKENIYF